MNHDIVVCKMSKSKKTWAARIVDFASNSLFLKLVFALFIIQAVYLAISIENNVAPDQAFHNQMIGFLASENINPFNHGPQTSNFNLGSTYGLPDTAYHYMFSYVHRFFALFVSDNYLITIVKLLNVAIATLSLYTLKLLSDEAKVLPLARNLGLFWISNILMFIFLSGSVNYDNLSFLLIFSSYHFLLKFHNTKSIKYLLLLGITAFLGPLVKITHLAVLPFELIGLIIVLYHSLNKKLLARWLIEFKRHKAVLTAIISVFIITVGLSSYKIGSNIYKYGSYAPRCEQTITIDQCRQNSVYVRNENLSKEKQPALDSNTVNKMEYFADWLLLMHDSNYGILGHKVTLPLNSISYSMFAFLLLGIASAVRTYNPKTEKVMGFYFLLSTSVMLILINKNYGSYVNTGLKNLAVQGRYIMPVFLPIIIIGTHYTMKMITSNRLRALYIIILVTVAFAGATPSLIYKVDEVWYTPETKQLNTKINQIMHNTL